jgi:hypothetical protein
MRERRPLGAKMRSPSPERGRETRVDRAVGPVER